MPTLRPFDDARDSVSFARTIALSFGGTAEGVRGYFDLAGREHLRVLDEGPGVPISAGLARIPMGHFVGGRSVRTIGIAAVGVAPEARGAGRALALMRAAVEEASAERAPLVSLYASTQALYRQVGFEQAGAQFTTSLPLRQLTAGTRDLPIEPIAPFPDGVPPARLARCANRYAEAFEGMLDRGPFIWKRIQHNRDQTFHGFAIAPDGPNGEIEGYVFVGQVRRDGGRHDVVLSDVAFTTARAGQRILGFLRDYTSMGLTLSFVGGSCHPLVRLLPQQWIEMSFKDYWMVRISDLAGAIATRGYSPSVTIDEVIEVDDPIVSANAGRWRLRVHEGRGSIARTDAAPVFRCDIRILASIYTSFTSPTQTLLLGQASGNAAAARRLDGAFAGTAPWMVDHF